MNIGTMPFAGMEIASEVATNRPSNVLRVRRTRAPAADELATAINVCFDPCFALAKSPDASAYNWKAEPGCCPSIGAWNNVVPDNTIETIACAVGVVNPGKGTT